ncbi:MAG: hypothetical protein AAF799_30805 [Myxococcota bacterium]
MGDDATNRWLFAGDSTQAQYSMRLRLQAFLREHLSRHGYERAPGDRVADRSFVLGPPARWIWIGDSFDSLDGEYCRNSPSALTHQLDLRRALEALGPDAVHPGTTPRASGPGELAPLLSHLGPVAKVEISDSSIVHIELFERGREIDRFANGVNPFYCFPDAKRAAPWRGHPERWEPLLRPGRTVDELRAAWTQAIGRWPEGRSASCDTITAACIELLGFSELVDRGYTWNPEGLDYRYTAYLDPATRHACFELHFRWPGSPGRGRWDRE